MKENKATMFLDTPGLIHTIQMLLSENEMEFHHQTKMNHVVIETKIEKQKVIKMLIPWLQRRER